MKPLYTTPFDALTFDILIQEMVFQDVDWVLSGLTHLKRCSPLSVPALFCLFAISLLSKLLFLLVWTDQEPGTS